MLTPGVFLSGAEPPGPLLPNTQAALPAMRWEPGTSQGLPMQPQHQIQVEEDPFCSLNLSFSQSGQRELMAGIDVGA